MRERIDKAACVDSPVLVTGETGTGKELVARRLHARGPRQQRPFVALNCAALVEGLLESELFGHEKGAFTGAAGRHEGRIVQAGKGTLFLDEVGDLPAALQAKLLRVLSEGTFTRVGGSDTLRLECRVVAATNRDLQAMVEAQTFRQDLYYRLAVVEIHLPPLRERGRDVELLAEAAIERLSARWDAGRRDSPPTPAPLLLAYPWPGNVRELFNVLERALVLLEGDTLDAADLPAEIRSPAPLRGPRGRHRARGAHPAGGRAASGGRRAPRRRGRKGQDRRDPRHLVADPESQDPRVRPPAGGGARPQGLNETFSRASNTSFDRPERHEWPPGRPAVVTSCTGPGSKPARLRPGQRHGACSPVGHAGGRTHGPRRRIHRREVDHPLSGVLSPGDRTPGGRGGGVHPLPRGLRPPGPRDRRPSQAAEVHRGATRSERRAPRDERSEDGDSPV